MIGTLWVTGVAGFSGRHLVSRLAEAADRPSIVGLDRGGRPSVPLDDYVQIDLCDAAAVHEAARAAPPTWVIHLAGGVTAPSSADLWRINAGSTLGLATGLVRAGCRGARLLTIGSAAEYAVSTEALTEDSDPGPTTEYGATKLAQTWATLGMASSLGLETCVARTFNLIGPGLPSAFICGRLCEQFARVAPRGIVVARHGRWRRDFVDVRDAVDAYWAIVRQGRPGQIYNVCSGRGTGLDDITRLLSALTAKEPTIQLDGDAADPGATQVVGSFRKLHEETGWQPRFDLETSLRDMLTYVEHHAEDAAAESRP
jgi:GDP-4-dehydro-6-deoxy-D-mannose reductase